MLCSELNALYEGEPFELSKRYAVVLNNVFVALFFSAGMPLLLLIVCGTFFAIYWMDKTSCTCIRPPQC